MKIYYVFCAHHLQAWHKDGSYALLLFSVLQKVSPVCYNGRDS